VIVWGVYVYFLLSINTTMLHLILETRI
jgi:hypothetical protein